jgi:hypothetical protein
MVEPMTNAPLFEDHGSPPDDEVSPISEVIRRIRRNPVLIVFFLAAVIDVAVAEDVTWRAGALAVLGVVTRYFTAPAVEIDEREALAFDEGQAVGEIHAVFALTEALDIEPEIVIDPDLHPAVRATAERTIKELQP